jgi:hypothetical protein
VVKARDRFIVALFVVVVGFGGYWVGKSVIHTGREYGSAAADTTTTTTSAVQRRADDKRRRKRNLEIVGGLAAAGALYVVIPALFGIPERRWRRRQRKANAPRA